MIRVLMTLLVYCVSTLLVLLVLKGLMLPGMPLYGPGHAPLGEWPWGGFLGLNLLMFGPGVIPAALFYRRAKELD